MLTRRADKRQGAALVRRALRHGLVPEFQEGVPLRDQTPATRWALHLLAVMSIGGKADMEEVKRVVTETRELLPQ